MLNEHRPLTINAVWHMAGAIVFGISSCSRSSARPADTYDRAFSQSLRPL